MKRLGPGMLLALGLLGGGGKPARDAAPAPAYASVPYRPLPTLRPVPPPKPAPARAGASQGNPAVCLLPEIPECPRAAFLVRVAATDEKYLGKRRAQPHHDALFANESPSCLRIRDTAAACGGYVKLSHALPDR